MPLSQKGREDKCLENTKGERGVEKTPLGLSKPIHYQKDRVTILTLSDSYWLLLALEAMLLLLQIQLCYCKQQRTNSCV